MRTIRFFSFLIIGLIVIVSVVSQVPFAVAQQVTLVPCDTSTSATGAAAGTVIAPAAAPAPPMRTMVPLGVPSSLDAWNAAALKGCQDLKSLITPGNTKLLGFDSVQDASLVQIGFPPFDIYSIGIDQLRLYSPQDPVLSLVKHLDSRLYPLSVVGEVRSSLLVSLDKSKNELVTTSWGLRFLIRDLTKYRASVRGFSLGFVLWIPALNLHFLGDNLNEDLLLIPLADRPAYGLIKGQPISAKIVFALYRRESISLDNKNPG